MYKYIGPNNINTIFKKIQDNKTKKYYNINTNIEKLNTEIKLENIVGAGIICMNKNNYNFLLIYNRNKYGFPKGHLKKNESYINGAFREFKEETGINKNLQISGFMICKSVVFFIVFTSYEFILNPENIITKDEVSHICWKNIYDLLPNETTIGIKTFINFSNNLKKLDVNFNIDKLIIYRKNYYLKNYNYVLNIIDNNLLSYDDFTNIIKYINNYVQIYNIFYKIKIKCIFKFYNLFSNYENIKEQINNSNNKLYKKLYKNIIYCIQYIKIFTKIINSFNLLLLSYIYKYMKYISDNFKFIIFKYYFYYKNKNYLKLQNNTKK